LIFEGKASSDKNFQDKINRVLDAKMKPKLVIVKNTPERCLLNSMARFNEYGRGTTVNIIADFYVNIYNWISEIVEIYEDKVEIGLFDFCNNENFEYFNGHQHISLLKTKETKDEIKEHLLKIVEKEFEAEKIPGLCRLQAKGIIPDFGDYLGRKDIGGYEKIF
jgi:hypothetical protein